MEITSDIHYIGVNDHQIDLFEGIYKVPNGMSYNSYVIIDEKIAIMDTVDEQFTETWFENLEREIGGRKPDYLIVQHMEPDHSANVVQLLRKYPGTILVATSKAFDMMEHYFGAGFRANKKVVKDGEELSLGKHILKFISAPMVHWPEVMVTYDYTDKVLFSADGFGKFGALEATEDDDWACEARRYYFNIVGKYGIAVQALLGKVKDLKIQTICPAHGPILTQPLEEYLRLYDTWSRYEPETNGVLIAFGSFHGNSRKAAEYLAKRLAEKGFSEIVLRDMARDDMAEVIEDAFRYDRMVLVASSYEGGVFPQIKDFLHRLQSKGYQKRKVAIVENGTWAPSAGRTIREMLEHMKAIEIVEPMVTIYSSMNQRNMEEINTLADEML